MAASEEGQVECVRMLLNKGADFNMQKKVSCIHRCESYGNYHCLYDAVGL